MKDNQELTSKELEDIDPEGLIHSYVASRKLANKMNVSVTLHYEGHDYTIKPMRLGDKVNSLKEQLTAAQQKLDVAVEALKEIERAIPIETPDKLGLPLVKICQIALEALNTIGK